MRTGDSSVRTEREGSWSLMPMSLSLAAGVAMRQLQGADTETETSSLAPGSLSPTPQAGWPQVARAGRRQEKEGEEEGRGAARQEESPPPPLRPPATQPLSPIFERHSETSVRLWGVPSPFNGGLDGDAENVFGEL